MAERSRKPERKPTPRQERTPRTQRRFPVFQSYMPTDTTGAPIEHNRGLRIVLRILAGIIAIAFALLMAVVFTQVALSQIALF